MSRLEQHHKKQIRINIILTLFILIGVIVFILTTGIKLLLSGSAYIDRLTEKKSNSTSLNKNENFYGGVDIDSIPVATNSARFQIGGSVMNFSELDFYINGEKVKETTLTSSDTFSEEIGDLNPGSNDVYIVAKSENQEQEKKSKIFTVEFKNEKPKLDVSEPEDNSKTNQQEVRISGATDKETYVRINDLPVVVDAQGNFQTSVRLKEGENKITITAEDQAGNLETRILTLIFQKDD